jgi:acyl-CoA synthetase (AMP-forming)/AMP-acid ligase II
METMNARVTVVGGLLNWLTEPSPARGLGFLDDRGQVRRSGYDELARAALSTAAQLAERGTRPGSVVTIVQPTGPEFVTAFFGILAAGCTPSPLAPPFGVGAARLWERHAAAAVAASGAELIVTAPGWAEQLTSITGRPVFCPRQDERAFTPLPPAPLSLLQFTSGSRAAVRGVRVPREALEANLAAIRSWLRLDGLFGTSWLPFHHDMGLVGALLTPVVYQADQNLITPMRFLTAPADWLRTYSHGAGEIMVMPDFGFRHVVSLVSPADLRGLDLSALRVLISGAERVRLGSLLAFQRLLAPFGFRSATLVPAYGLAEATLAVTGVPHDDVPSAVRVRPGPVRMGLPIAIEHTAPISELAAADGNWHVSCGRPVDDAGTVTVRHDGHPVPDGHVGEIVVTGPSVALGYAGPGGDAGTGFADDGSRGTALHTGDAGFMHKGDLYVLGRIGDSLQVRGRNVYVEDLEASLADAGLLPQAVILAGYLDDSPNVWVLTVGFADPASAEQAVRVICSAAGDDLVVRVVRVEPSAIERTTSGKPRRRSMWEKVLAGQLTGATLASS